MEGSKSLPLQDAIVNKKMNYDVMGQTEEMMNGIMSMEEMNALLEGLYDNQGALNNMQRLPSLNRTNSLTPVDQKETSYRQNPGIAAANELYQPFDLQSPFESLNSSPSKTFEQVTSTGSFGAFSNNNSLNGSLASSRVPSLNSSVFSSPAKAKSSVSTKGNCKGPRDEVTQTLEAVSRALTPVVEKTVVGRLDFSGIDSDAENNNAETNTSLQSDEERIVSLGLNGNGKRERSINENPTQEEIDRALATTVNRCRTKADVWGNINVWSCPHCPREFKLKKNLLQHFYGKRGHECTKVGNAHYGIVDNVRVVPMDFNLKKYKCPVPGCTASFDEKRQLHKHFDTSEDGFRSDHTNIDFSCLCPKRGKNSNVINIKGATTMYQLNGNVVEVLDRQGNVCLREKDADGDFVDAQRRKIDSSGLPIPVTEPESGDESDGSVGEKETVCGNETNV